MKNFVQFFQIPPEKPFLKRERSPVRSEFQSNGSRKSSMNCPPWPVVTCQETASTKKACSRNSEWATKENQNEAADTTSCWIKSSNSVIHYGDKECDPRIKPFSKFSILTTRILFPHWTADVFVLRCSFYCACSSKLQSAKSRVPPFHWVFCD